MTKLALLAAASLVAMPASAATVYSNDFDSAATTAPGVTATLTNGTTDSATVGAWNASGWAGTFFINTSAGNPATASVLTISGLAPNSAVKLSGIIGLLDSWDGYDGDGGYAPDILSFSVNGGPVTTMTSNAALGSAYDVAGASLVALYEQTDSNGYFSDILADLATAPFLSGTTADGSGIFTLSIVAGGAGWQGGDDENWGLDALSVDGTVGSPFHPPVPEPATWAMMIGGMGLVGAAMRRRARAALRHA